MPAVNTGEIHALITKREDRYRKMLEAQQDYNKACEELREKINSLNKSS